MNERRLFDPSVDAVTPEGEVIWGGQVNGAVEQTGLVVVQTKDTLAALVDQKNVPIHIAKMQELDVTPEVMASYVNVPWVDIFPYINKVVKVVGCAIWFSGEFTPKKRPDEVESGYHKVLFKLEETRKVTGIPIGDRAVSLEQNVVISTGAKKVAEIALVYLNKHGWFDWPDGTFEYILFGGTKESGYLAQPVNELVAAVQKSQK